MHEKDSSRRKVAILYGAKSTADPRGSIDTQLDDARVMAEANGYEVVASFEDEARSAYSGNRGPGLAAAKALAAELAAAGHDVAISSSTPTGWLAVTA